MLNQNSILPAIVLLVGLSQGAATLAAPWVEQGPGPILNGANTEGMPGPNPVAGAINAIVPDPTSADIVFVGTVNGGVWKTSNATAATPTWTPLTDTQLPALSIDSLAMSPVNPNTLFAGTGSTSSKGFGFNGEGSPGFGVARSTDGGVSWTVLAASTFAGKRIDSIVPTSLSGGNVVLAATLFDRGGVYRSTDNGASFTRISGSAGSGLPDGGVSKLIADPSNSNRFYAGVPQFYGGGAQAGVYRSDDGGLTWTAVNTGLTGLPTSLRILLSVHNDASNNVLYAAIIATNGVQTNGTLGGVFRTTNQGGIWTGLGVPSPPIFPGAQGVVHGALAADPANPNIVFIAGDAQASPFPNVNGCTSFTANTFRYTGTVWENVVCAGANATSPHPDSRDMQFDTDGNLLQTNDGGIYRLVSPNTAATRRWVPVVGNIRPTEYHSVAFDPLSKVTFGGTQDNGTPYQLAPGGFTGNELVGGDGGAVAVDGDQVAHLGTTLRYTSSQFFGCAPNNMNVCTQSGNFNRTTWNAANTRIGGLTFVGLNITAGAGAGQTLYQFDHNIQFFNPYVLNAIDPSRMLIGTANIYESLNRGDSLNNLIFTGFFIGGRSGLGQPLAYGGRLNGTAVPDVFYVGAGATIFHRVSGSIVTLPAYPGATVHTIVMNPQNYRQVFVADSANRVWGSFDEGTSWIELTANLLSLTSQVDTIEVFSPDQTIRNTVLIAGGFGAFQMRRPGAGGASWTPLSTGIPNALVQDLHYDYLNNVLVAGSLGRGSWTLSSFFRGGGGTGSGLVAAASRAPSLPQPPLDLPPEPSAANVSAPDTP